MQIHITRACDLACCHCTQGSNLRGKPVMMTVEEFSVAVDSIRDYWGVVGIFGGNPALHPDFEALCEILAVAIPWSRRGIWCNHPRGNGAIMRRYFNPAVSNLNVHLVQDAYDEFRRDWPESEPYLKGNDTDSLHAPVFVSMTDLDVPEDRRWELISGCDINHDWSAMICTVPYTGGRRVQGFFCEIAGAMAMLHSGDDAWPDLGIDVEAWPGWWKRPMQEFSEQVRQYCHRCGVPLRRHGSLAQNGSIEEITSEHASIYKPKRQEVQLVQLETDSIGGHVRRATEYIENGREASR